MSTYYRDRAHRAACAKRVIDLMRERGVSRNALAASVRIQRSTLDNFCAGGPSLPSDVMELIALELRTTARDLTSELHQASPL